MNYNNCYVIRLGKLSLNQDETLLKYIVCGVVSLYLALFLSSEEEEAESEEEGEDPTLDSLSQAIAFQVSLHLVK